MTKQSEFVSFLLEQMQAALTGTGTVSARAMFGGHGLYFHDLGNNLSNNKIMFALVADDELYFKTDAQNRHDFETRGLGPFVYEKDGKPVSMSYHAAPEEIFDDPDEMRAWVLSAINAAHRSRR